MRFLYLMLFGWVMEGGGWFHYYAHNYTSALLCFGTALVAFLVAGYYMLREL